MPAQQLTTIEAILDRAASDPDFLRRLAGDPFGVLAAEGYDLPPAELRALLDMPRASEGELAEALQARISHSGSGGSFQTGALIFAGGAS